MRKIFLVGVLSVAALSGCANLQDLNTSLKKANDALAGASSLPVGQLGDGTGYQPVFNIAVPGGVCNRPCQVACAIDKPLSMGSRTPISRIGTSLSMAK